MLAKHITAVCISAFMFCGTSFAKTSNTETKAQYKHHLSNLTIPFIQNHGQQHDDVAYYAKTFAGTVFVNKQGELIYSLPISKTDRNQAWVIKETLLSTKTISPEAGKRATADVNYFVGNKRKWQSGVSSFENVKLKNAYPGIDVQFQAKSANIEKLFYVQAHAKAEQIRLQVEGVDSIQVNAQKQLVLNTEAGDIKFTKPVAFQVINDQRVPVEVAYRVNGNSYGFQLGEYDESHELIIDPLIAATFIGGTNTSAISDFESVADIVEHNGSVFITGTTDSTDFPVTTGFTTFQGSFYDAYVAKFSADLSSLEAATYFGSTGPDTGEALAIDNNGDVYVAGIVTSTLAGIPITGGGFNANPTYNSGTFVVKLSNDLSTLQVSSIPVGRKTYPSKLLLANNSLYLSGRTNSPAIPTNENSWDSTCGGDGACDPSGSFSTTRYYGYIIRMDNGLSDVLASTYLGRSGGRDIAAGSNSNIYAISVGDVVVGTSIVGLDANLSSSFGNVSFPYNNTITALAVNDSAVAIVGTSRDPNLPVTGNAFDSGCGTDGACDPTGATNYLTADGFFAQYSLDLQTTNTLSYFGGTNSDAIGKIYYEPDNTFLLVGSTSSSNFPVTNDAVDNSLTGTKDNIIARLNAAMTDLLYSSYLDLPDGANVGAIHLSSTGDIYFAGSSDSSYPVTQGAYDTSFNGGDKDVYVALWDISTSNGGGGSGPVPGPGPNPGPVNEAPVADAGANQAVIHRTKVTLNGSNSRDSDGSIAGYQWSQVSGKGVKIKNANSAVATFTAPRTRRGRTRTLVFELTVTDDGGARSTDQVTIRVTR